ncbi:MAG: diaminopimelate decarboxylase [Phycisphaerales bacterium]
MDHFEYRSGQLCCEGVDLARVAERAGTPTYVYSAATLRTHYDKLAAAFAELNPLICFAVKSCPNLHVLRVLADRGAGMDVVSGGELMRAEMADVPRGRIVYAGVGKTDAEIRSALGAGSGAGPIALFNVESEAECENVATIAREMNLRARALVRVNPEVPAGGHAYIATAKKDSKFGVDFATAKRMFARFRDESHLWLCGLHIHIGSSINDPAPHARAIERTLALADEIDAAGRVAGRAEATIDTLDIGGGFGADYSTGDAPPAAVFAEKIVPLLRERARAGLKVILEPGRTIAASAGVLLTRVLYVKPPSDACRKRFIICDAGMHTLLRPSLYGAFHFIWPASVPTALLPARRAEKPDLPGLSPADVVGPICESGDFLAHDRFLPDVKRGDLLAVFTAGAYGMSMASRYNSHGLPAEVLVDGDVASVVREREALDDLVRHEQAARLL